MGCGPLGALDRVVAVQTVFRNVDAHALANLRFCLAFQPERVFEEDFNERCYAAANLAHVFPIAMAFAVA
jgi:hypothetical protein